MGYWDFIRPHLVEAAGGRAVRVIARPRSASPAEGSAARHTRQQQLLVEAALAPMAKETAPRAKPGATPKPEQVAG
jgi:2-oxoglutarate dehydrogenase complex dehydrogenase (E1) component-like enzyme